MKQKILLQIKRILASELISGSFYLFIGATAGNILAFLFNLFLVRHLSFAGYAEISALISLITLATIPAQAIQTTTIQFAGKFLAKKQLGKAAYFYKQSNVRLLQFAFIFFVVFLVFSPFLANFLHIKNSIEIVIVGIIIAAVYIGITNTSFLQAMLHFQFISFTTIFGALLKLILGIIALLCGFGIVGVLWGYFFTFLIPYLLTFIPLKILRHNVQAVRESISSREIFSYAAPTTLAILSLSSFTSTDILLVKHFFPALQAGYYSGLSLVGRIIFYFSAPIATVMFPLVIKRYHQGKKPNGLLYLSFLLVLLPSIALTLFYFIFPKIMISIFLGKNYFSIAPYLGWFGLYLCIFSLLNVLINFFLSIKKTNISLLIVVGAILQIVGIVIFHKTIAQIISISLGISLVLFILLLLYYMRLYEKNKT